MPTVLITGCDSGIGREFARQYAESGWRVVATYRDLAYRLPDRADTRHVGLDVTRFEQFVALKSTLGDEPIDVLVSNAGIGRDTMKLGASTSTICARCTW